MTSTRSPSSLLERIGKLERATVHCEDGRAGTFARPSSCPGVFPGEVVSVRPTAPGRRGSRPGRCRPLCDRLEKICDGSEMRPTPSPRTKFWFRGILETWSGSCGLLVEVRIASAQPMAPGRAHRGCLLKRKPARSLHSRKRMEYAHATLSRWRQLPATEPRLA